jgi:hypothetical protein
MVRILIEAGADVKSTHPDGRKGINCLLDPKDGTSASHKNVTPVHSWRHCFVPWLLNTDGKINDVIELHTLCSSRTAEAQPWVPDTSTGSFWKM